MVLYNITNITNSNNILEMYNALDSLTNNLFTPLIMFTLFIVIFMALYNLKLKYVIFADSFVLTIIGILFITLGTISWVAVLPYFSIFFLSLLYLVINRE